MPKSSYDVFVSYSHDDSHWIKNELLTRLESHSFSYFIDFQDFVAGKSGIEEMERGVLESRRTLVVLSPNYVKSEWTKFENVMAQTTDPGASKRKLIPILIEDCKIPLRLSIIQYRDLRSGDPDEWDRLFRDLI